MLTAISKLEKTLIEFNDKINDKSLEIGDIIIWMDKYIRTVFENYPKEKKGDELKVALDTAFNISISLFKLIDSGETGIDDKLSEELGKIKVKYLGGLA